MGFLDFFSRTPSRDKFAKLYIKAAERLGIREALTYDPGEFMVQVEGQSKRFFLHNAYRDYCAAPRREREAVLEKYLQGFNAQGVPESYEEAKKHLMPVLRGKGMVECLRLMQAIDGGEPDPVAFQAFSQDAVVMLVHDGEHTMHTLNSSSLAKWNVSFDEAFAAACDNLREMTVKSYDEFVPGLYAGSWQDCYDSSRILFPDVMYQTDLGDSLVVMIPTRSCLLVASATNREAMLAMVEAARLACEKEGRLVSSLMYCFDTGRATEYRPKDEAVQAKLEELRMAFLAEDYAVQKQLLDKLHEKRGIDAFVATYQLVGSKQGGRTYSMAVWTEGIDTLIPQTDLVALVRVENEAVSESKLVKWQDAFPSPKDELELMEGYPARYRIRRFEDQSRLTSLPAFEF